MNIEKIKEIFKGDGGKVRLMSQAEVKRAMAAQQYPAIEVDCNGVPVFRDRDGKIIQPRFLW